jgi:hypothetical protein
MTNPPQTPQERLQAAAEALNALNSGIGPQIQPQPFAEVAAAVDAIVQLLMAKGLLTEQEFVDGKANRLADILEEIVRQGREAKRKATGLVIPGVDPQSLA